MADLGEIQTDVAALLQDPDHTAVSLSQITSSVNRAVRYWKKRRFYFNEVTDTDTLTESDPEIPLPSNWLCPSIDDAFVIEYSGIRYPLKKVSESQYNAMYLSNGIGRPCWYAKLANDQYQVYPIPDRAYTIRRFYLKEYDALSSDTETNDWTEEAQDLTTYTAAAYASRDYRQDLEMSKAFMSQANSEYQNLLLQTRKDNATGSLTITSMLTSY